MAVSGIKPYIGGRIWILGLITVAVYIVLTIFCNTKINFRLSNKKDIKIEKIVSVMVEDSYYGSAEESQHEEQKVTFTYNSGKSRITENYNLNSSRQKYFYNKLVKEKEYYTINILLIALMCILGLASFVGLLFSIEDESFDKYASDLDDWKEIYGFKSGIIKQLMIFCGYTDMDRVVKVAEEINPWKKSYSSYNILIPSYREIWNYFKDLHEKVDERIK